MTKVAGVFHNAGGLPGVPDAAVLLRGDVYPIEWIETFPGRQDQRAVGNDGELREQVALVLNRPPIDRTPRSDPDPHHLLSLRVGSQSARVFLAGASDEEWRAWRYLLEGIEGPATPSSWIAGAVRLDDGWTFTDMGRDWLMIERTRISFESTLALLDGFVQVAMRDRSPHELRFFGSAVQACGQTVWLVGPPRSGKTTLAVALGLLGAQAFSDDYVFWHRELRTCQPFRKAYRLGIDRREMFPELRDRGLPGTRWFINPGRELAGWAPDEPAPLAAVFFVDRHDDAGPRLQPIAVEDCRARLVRACLGSVALAALQAGHVGDALTHVPAYALSYDDPRAAARGIMSLLQARA